MGDIRLILLDTCTLLWWTLEPRQLSSTAREICAKISQEGAYISSISIWEIGIKMQKSVLDIGISLREYVQRLKTLGTIDIVPVDDIIWIENIMLDWAHRDPADRTIVATANIHELPILTKDKIILDYYRDAIW